MYSCLNGKIWGLENFSIISLLFGFSIWCIFLSFFFRCLKLCILKVMVMVLNVLFENGKFFELFCCSLMVVFKLCLLILVWLILSILLVILMLMIFLGCNCCVVFSVMFVVLVVILSIILGVFFFKSLMVCLC